MEKRHEDDTKGSPSGRLPSTWPEQTSVRTFRADARGALRDGDAALVVGQRHRDLYVPLRIALAAAHLDARRAPPEHDAAPRRPVAPGDRGAEPRRREQPGSVVEPGDGDMRARAGAKPNGQRPGTGAAGRSSASRRRSSRRPPSCRPASPTSAAAPPRGRRPLPRRRKAPRPARRGSRRARRGRDRRCRREARPRPQGTDARRGRRHR